MTAAPILQPKDMTTEQLWKVVYNMFKSRNFTTVIIQKDGYQLIVRAKFILEGDLSTSVFSPTGVCMTPTAFGEALMRELSEL